MTKTDPITDKLTGELRPSAFNAICSFQELNIYAILCHFKDQILFNMHDNGVIGSVIGINSQKSKNQNDVKKSLF